MLTSPLLSYSAPTGGSLRSPQQVTITSRLSTTPATAVSNDKDIGSIITTASTPSAMRQELSHPISSLSTTLEKCTIGKQVSVDNGSPQPVITLTAIPSSIVPPSGGTATPPVITTSTASLKEVMLQKQNSLDVPKDDIRKLAVYPRNSSSTSLND